MAFLDWNAVGVSQKRFCDVARVIDRQPVIGLPVRLIWLLIDAVETFVHFFKILVTLHSAGVLVDKPLDQCVVKVHIRLANQRFRKLVWSFGTHLESSFDRANLHRSALYGLHGIAHGVHQMVKIIDRLVDRAAEFVLGPLVVLNLRDEVHTARLDDDLVVLDKLNAGSYGVGAFFRSVDFQAQTGKLID